MSRQIWENLISLNSHASVMHDNIGPISLYLEQDDLSIDWDRKNLPLKLAIKRDTSPLPRTEDREEYYGDNHFNYWASGLRDVNQIVEWLGKNSLEVCSFLDIGCATGRILRHLCHQNYNYSLTGCDINRKHVDWIVHNLPESITVIQNTSLPHLPFSDESIDFISAFSVFTHIECFDTSWIMELRRVLRNGGIAWITINSERVWKEMSDDWPVYSLLDQHPDYQGHRYFNELPGERVVYRWHADRSYTSNVFYSTSYIKKTWGRILSLKEIITAIPAYQDIVILQK